MVCGVWKVERNGAFKAPHFVFFALDPPSSPLLFGSLQTFQNATFLPIYLTHLSLNQGWIDSQFLVLGELIRHYIQHRHLKSAQD